MFDYWNLISAFFVGAFLVILMWDIKEKKSALDVILVAAITILNLILALKPLIW